ncbi:hypothetical protein HaLaN_18591 [Haematococcus lacustris]|uniref:Uncharacterized protein n=1 Tax=Haematococcus lacustris TaxID=44745 RepID=A0A699ZH87_HAELA|nr:hypothetical protein HaLaN_18591 [Haematococcus lacustris]
MQTSCKEVFILFDRSIRILSRAPILVMLSSSQLTEETIVRDEVVVAVFSAGRCAWKWYGSPGSAVVTGMLASQCSRGETLVLCTLRSLEVQGCEAQEPRRMCLYDWMQRCLCLTA